MARPSQPARPRAGLAFGPTLIELAASLGGYYLLRAFGVGAFWSLLVPTFVVGAITIATTVRRGRLDFIGLFVLLELGVSIAVSLATHSARIAALRESLYFTVAAIFFLASLTHGKPVSHTFTASGASFGDPARVAAFADAWKNNGRYRRYQRLLTATLGLVLLAGATSKAIVIITAQDTRLTHAINVSNVLTFVMLIVIAGTSVVLIQPLRKIIESLTQSAAST